MCNQIILPPSADCIGSSMVEYEGGFLSEGLSEGNERRRFHGTKRACRLGDDGLTTLCGQYNCSLCSIILESFKLDLAGTNKMWANRKTGR